MVVMDETRDGVWRGAPSISLKYRVLTTPSDAGRDAGYVAQHISGASRGSDLGPKDNAVRVACESLGPPHHRPPATWFSKKFLVERIRLHSPPSACLSSVHHTLGDIFGIPLVFLPRPSDRSTGREEPRSRGLCCCLRLPWQ